MAARKVNNKKLETSKEIVVVVQVIFSVAMIASYTLPIFFENMNELVLSVFQTTATQTGSILLGYYGKAGFENYDKNKNLLKFEKKKDNSDDEPEGGNG